MKRAPTKKIVDNANVLFHAICTFDAQHNRAPVIRDLLGVAGLRSTSTINRYLNLLVEWGWIQWNGNRRGTLQIIRPTERIFYRRKVAS